eukprot:GHVU01011052.1.p1 GENE.GHVU01011052.1~~GHVU01011052.1.p1  ORF type:complete len:130 (+),score=2.74 GHVU01011052.1:573-962(+)
MNELIHSQRSSMAARPGGPTDRPERMCAISYSLSSVPCISKERDNDESMMSERLCESLMRQQPAWLPGSSRGSTGRQGYRLACRPPARGAITAKLGCGCVHTDTAQRYTCCTAVSNKQSVSQSVSNNQG